MNLLLVVTILGLFAFAGFAMWIASVRSRYRSRVHKSRLNKIAKENKLVQVKEEAGLVKSRVSMLRSQLDALIYAQEQSAALPEDAPATKKKRPVMDILQEQGLITQADITQAQEFKKKAGSDASLPEILVLLGKVTPEQMNDIKYNS